MATNISYKCDDCQKEISWELRHSMVRIQIERQSSDTILSRDYCANCWAKREAEVIKSAR